ncbi:MAG: 30S ribosomal protein S20 [Succinivibrio sp.]
MPNIKSAKKRVELSEKARQHNVAARSKMRTLIKNVIKAVQSGDKEAAKSAFSIAEPVLDRAANKGLVHKNKVARHKSNLSALIKAMN